MKYIEIINFWFEELTPNQWFKTDETLDLKMTEKYIALHSCVTAGEYSFWRNDPLGRLAEILVVDQFSRNIYRDDPKSFIYDPLSLALAQECIRGEYHLAFTSIQKQFLYMPFMHSESTVIHNTALLLFSEPGLEEGLGHELKHKEVVERFGRFPHRNAILSRQSTLEENEYLKNENSILENESSWSWSSAKKESTISIQ